MTYDVVRTSKMKKNSKMDSLKNEDDLKNENDLKKIIWPPPTLREYYLKFF